MSIANALNNAISGLTAAARGTEIVSSNLANALTPGYARRELDLSARVLSGNGGGVHIDGVSRVISDAVLSDFRLASSGLAKSTVTHDFYSALEKAIGLPQDSASLSAVLGDFENALTAAASRPDSNIRLRAVVDSATNLTQKIKSISDSIQDSRSSADRQISLQVGALNNDLEEVARLNRQIIVEGANGRDVSSLADARQAAIDRISKIVPVRELPREHGRIALFTLDGATLLDGKTPTEISFTPAGRLTADMDASAAVLGKLTVDGAEIPDIQTSLFSGGSLAELFRVRDDYAVAEQAAMDSIARELHDRFADPTLDPTLLGGASGLFADAAGTFDPANERGLSTRLKLNPLADPALGGELWRIRDGIGASAPGDVGNSTIIDALAQRMNAVRPFASLGAPGPQGSLATLSAEILSGTSTQKLATETRKAHDSALQNSLQSALFTEAVDSDREMEALLQLENAYAANAKVIQAVNEMLENILRI